MLKLLRKQEKLISTLYSSYGKVFPEHRAFWKTIAAEEKDHAAWLNRLAKKVKSGEAVFIDGRFDPVMIEKSLNFIHTQIEKSHRAGFTILNALSMALAIEKGMIESTFFKVVDGDHEDLHETLEYLSKSTKEHARRIEDEWKTQLHAAKK